MCVGGGAAGEGGEGGLEALESVLEEKLSGMDERKYGGICNGVLFPASRPRLFGSPVSLPGLLSALLALPRSLKRLQNKCGWREASG